MEDFFKKMMEFMKIQNKHLEEQRRLNQERNKNIKRTAEKYSKY